MNPEPIEPPRPPAPSLEEIFDTSAARVDAGLREVPDHLLEARRWVTRELGFDPTAEQLQTLVKLAHDRPADPALADYPERLLALLVRAQRTLRSLLDSATLSAGDARLDARITSLVLVRSARLEAELRALLATADSLSVPARGFLLRVERAFAIPRDTLLAALTVAPRLAEFADAESVPALQAAIPFLTDAEATAVVDGLCGTGVGSDAAASRVIVDALALRTLMQEDLERWREILDRGDTDPAAAAERAALLEALKRGRHAYHVFAERLQKRRDAARVAGLERFARELAATGRSLFGVYVELAPAIRDAEPGFDEAAFAAETTRELLEQAEAADRDCETSAAGAVTREELYLDALKDTRSPAPLPPPVAGADELRRERRRVRALVGVAALLAAASVVVNFILFGARPPRVDLSPSDFDPSVAVRELHTLGPMMSAEVGTWQVLDEDERIEAALRLGQQASSRGIDSVYILEDTGKLAATWTRADGARLTEVDLHA